VKLSLDEKLARLSSLDIEILELIEEEATLADEIEQVDTYKEEIDGALIKIEHHCAPRPPMTPLLMVRTGRTPPTSAVMVKLPKLTIQPFNGDITLWTTF